MAMTMHVDIVSAESEIFSGTAEMVLAPAAMGEVGIMPRHTQMMTPLKPGEVRVTREGGEQEYFYVSGGIMEVQPHVVTVLSDTAVRAVDLDEAAALEAKKHAEESLKDRAGDMDYDKAEA
ncbi:MAG TPA: F0F1 ATP synthase subunit epsilon, partial [Gammaproteobacteria bacterium]|nr:F0F1 ATP synthase subunit epsilon [Gammaproteobacteria bacterium]